MEAEPETKVVARESKTTPKASASVVNLPAADTVVGRYELVHRLGHGGMATVHLARSTGRAGFEKLVAVKVIHPHLASEPEFVDMFLDEARIAARLHHPHIVQILDVDEADGIYFMVMEYVEGDTLSSLIRELRKRGEQLPMSAALQVAADAAAGLAAAHELSDRDGEPLQLVHRDVSPHNLLVGMDGHVKVVDFGIMKAAGKRSNTLTGQLRGKLSYMSPEQARGKDIDHRTDLFALGAVLWEMCTNTRLFEAATDSETLELVTKCRVPDLAEVRPDLSEGMAKILRKALARDPDDRYDTAQAMLRDIRAEQRDFDADVDPRADLAGTMSKYFAARIDYVRAAVRRRDGSGVRAVAAGSGSLPAPESAANGDATAVLSPRSAGESGAAVLPVDESRSYQTGTSTLTTALGQAPARHWSLWLVLPLVGAAIGTTVVGWGRDNNQGEVVAAAPVERMEQPKKTAEESPMTAIPERPRPVEESVRSVKWTFNTEPQGAHVTIAGHRHEEPTPFEVVLPWSDDAVLIVIEREGYRPIKMRRAPLKTDDHSRILTPLAPQGAKHSRVKPRLVAKKKKQPAQDVTTEPESAKPPAKTDDDPDFASLRRPRKSD